MTSLIEAMANNGYSLTKPQARVLGALRVQEIMTPAEIGYAMTPDRTPPLKAQGAGRLGGTMAWRLRSKGLVVSASHEYGGWPRYKLSAKARAMLSALPDTGGE